MAANKFATMVHKNTNKITLVLIYAFLEWTLIILLLLNSIFSYFIIKFARFFGLKLPCLWCTRLDRFFEAENKNSHRDLLCELHSKEVSKLGFCSKHKKLAESDDMCKDCSFGFDEKSKNFVVSEVCLKCSCCGVDFKKNGFEDSSCFAIDNSISYLIGSDLVSDKFGGKQEHQKQGNETEVTEIESMKKDFIQFEKREDSKSDKPTQDLEFLLDYSGNQLVPVEIIDPTTENSNCLDIDEDQEFGDFQKAEELLEENQETHFVVQESSSELLSVINKTEDSSQYAKLDSMEFEETDNSLVFHVNSNGYHDQNASISEPIQSSSDAKEVQETEESDSENEEEVSIGTEIPVLDACDEMKAQDNFNLYSLSREEPLTNSHDLNFNLECGFEEDQDDVKTEELNLNQLEDTMLMIERKGSMVDESLDGSEMEGQDSINIIEKLKSALRAERKVLQALYNELEEERSASAVAASETMAMINRLQEEKATMQMEALHYQRMMEEQAEYDQEALQLLNELMVKKDKELESYRKKVLDYELKDRTSSVRSVTFSASCSHSEDDDGGWIDLNHEPKEEEIPDENLYKLVVDFEDERLSILEKLKVLEEKLVTLSYEEDRIFGDLKDDYFEENGNFGKQQNEEYSDYGQEVNGGVTNGFPHESHEIYYQDRRAISSTGKRPFPRSDTLENESDDGLITSNGHGNGFHPEKMENIAVIRFELQKKRIDIEEEVDQLYVRLQALEADREFLKHSIGSLKKGDKGMKLLQEILQHLRDLRNIDLRDKSFTDGSLA